MEWVAQAFYFLHLRLIIVNEKAGGFFTYDL